MGWMKAYYQRTLCLIVTAWVLLVVVFVVFLVRQRRAPGGHMLKKRLEEATAMLTHLKVENAKLMERFKKAVPPDFLKELTHKTVEFSYSARLLEHERARRRLETTIQELYNYLSKANVKQSVLELTNEHRYNMLNDIKKLELKDYAWRKDELRQLAHYVQVKLDKLQNPLDCPTARKVICTLEKPCSFSCQIQHAIYCLTVAVATNRTLVMYSDGWYNRANIVDKSGKSGVWNHLFKPFSRTCTRFFGVEPIEFGAHIEAFDEVKLPFMSNVKGQPEYLAQAVPRTFSSKLQMLHGNPAAWFIGQLAAYIMRPSDIMHNHLNKMRARANFSRPVVGLHIRKVDRNGRSARHTFDEYIQRVDDFFNRTDLFNKDHYYKRSMRTVYLATDDPDVWRTQALNKTSYKFLGDPHTASIVSASNNRLDALKATIADIRLLSETDHLVCSMKSHLCRLAYVLRQSRETFSSENNQAPVDWSSAISSLDGPYFFESKAYLRQRALVAHKSNGSGQIDLKAGDILRFQRNNMDGFTEGTNERSSKMGIYPSFKTELVVREAKFLLFES